MSFLRILLLLTAVLLASACAPTRPDLSRLYADMAHDPGQPPVILIHGLGGSTLVDPNSGRQVWPGSLSTLALSNFSVLRDSSAEDREGAGLVPGGLMEDVVGVDFYGELLHTLENVGRFVKSSPGQPVGNERRRYYVLLYDWRKDNLATVRKLHALIEQIRRDYDDPTLRVDIIAHSNGGVVTNWYLRYGPNDLPASGAAPTPWLEGEQRVRRVLMLGTPLLGAATSLERLMYGTRLGLRTVPVEVMATFSTPYQALPHPLTQPIMDTAGKPVAVNIYDPVQWRQRKWGVYAPEVSERMRGAAATPAAGEQAVAQLQANFEAQLRRAERMQRALTAPLPPLKVQISSFGGDCEMTPGRAVLLDEAEGGRLLFRPGQVPGKGANGRSGRRGFERLMLEPGDGLVTRTSQTARRPPGVAAEDPGFTMLPIQGSFFLCESHGRLTHNLFFQDNLLYFLLSR